MLKNLRFIFLFTALAYSVSLTQAYAQEIEILYHQSAEKFRHYHEKLVELAIEIDTKERDKTTIKEGVTQSTKNSLLEWLIKSANAEEMTDAGLCLFGGWPSVRTLSGRCSPPWTHSNNEALSAYGPTYSRNHYCGRSNEFRCSPVLFGPGSDGKGRCVSYVTNEDISRNCFEQGRGHIGQVLHMYQTDPEFRDKYQQTASLMAQFCRENASYSACEYIIAQAVNVRNLNCEQDHLNHILRQEEMDRLSSNWGNINQHLNPEPLNQEIRQSVADDQRVERDEGGGLGTPMLSGNSDREDVSESGGASNWNSIGSSASPSGDAGSGSSGSSFTPVHIPDIDYSITNEEERDLIQRNRIETNDDIYGRLRTIARETYQNTPGSASAKQSACRRALDRAYESISPQPIWADLNLEQRANEVRNVANYTLAKINETGTEGTTRSDPNQIHSLLTPGVGTCIAYIETRGTLNPHAMNYTFCQANNNSTAHGLGQMTRRTFRGLRDQNLLPITVSPQYNDLDRDALFHKLNSDTILQMEVLFRYMNYELKGVCRNSSCSEEDLIRAVARYDQDNQSNYIRKFRACHRCIQALPEDGNAMSCYQSM